MNQTISILNQINVSFQHAGETQPQYQQMLPFFEALYELEETTISDNHPQGLDGAVTVPPSAALHGVPLFRREDLSFDAVPSKQLLGMICKLANQQISKLSQAASVLSACIAADDPAIEKGFEALLRNDGSALQTISQDLGIDQTVLIFFFYHSVWPSLAQHVRYVQERESVDPHWHHPYCPVCGSSPNLAFLSETGKRHLVCGFCRFEWPVKRMLCLSCTHSPPGSISYFFSEQERAYRVYVCEQCRYYIKTVDTRQLGRRFYAPLESLLTLHLDLQAESLGYRGGEQRHLFGG